MDQTVRLIVDQPATSSFWDAWGPSLITGGVSLLVALIALGGVLLSASKNRTAMIEAENLRAAKALDAEGVRHANAIEAENLRAAKMIAAEDRRHENTVRQEEIAWTRGAKAKAYFGLIEAMNRLTQAMTNTIWYMQPVVNKTAPNGNKRRRNAAKSRECGDDWNLAASDVRHRCSEIEAVGNPDIAATARKVVVASREAMNEARDAYRAHPEPLYNVEEVGARRKREARSLANEVRLAIRAELAPAGTSSAPNPESTTNPGEGPTKNEAS